MKQLRNYASASVGLVLLVTVIALSVPQTGHSALTPPDKDVRVINTNAEAIPVDVRGVVKAKQEGAWNVSIAGTPTVQVGNAAADPVLTRDVDRATAQPFHEETVLVLPDGFGGENAFIAIPAGKVLVVEHVSAIGTAPNDQFIAFSLGTRLSPDTVRVPHYLNATRSGITGGLIYQLSQQGRFYHDVGTLSVRAERQSGPTAGELTFRFTVSGYLVDK